MKRSHEPLAWSLFGGGGMLLAFAGPAVILVTGVLLAFVFSDRPEEVYSNLHQWLSNPIGQLLLLAFVSLSLFHTCHRLYHAMHDLHVGAPAWFLLTLFYGGATMLSVATALLLLSIGSGS